VIASLIRGLYKCKGLNIVNSLAGAKVKYVPSAEDVLDDATDTGADSPENMMSNVSL